MRGVVASVLGMLEEGATHVGVATDHVIESFRNDLWPGLQDGRGHRPGALRSVRAAGGGLARPRRGRLGHGGVRGRRCAGLGGRDGRGRCAASTRCSCARRTRIWRSACGATGSSSSTAARASGATRRGCAQKFGVPPASIPDWLALVGDSADGYPGLPGLGEDVRGGGARPLPAHRGAFRRSPPSGTCPVRGAARLAAILAEQRDRALLFRELATLRSRRAHRRRRRRGRAALDRAALRVRGVVHAPRLGRASRARVRAGGRARGRYTLSGRPPPSAGVLGRRRKRRARGRRGSAGAAGAALYRRLPERSTVLSMALDDERCCFCRRPVEVAEWTARPGWLEIECPVCGLYRVERQFWSTAHFKKAREPVLYRRLARWLEESRDRAAIRRRSRSRAGRRVARPPPGA